MPQSHRVHKEDRTIAGLFEKGKSNDGYNTYKGHVVRLTSESMDLKTIFTTLTELWENQRQLEEEVSFPYQLYYSKYF